MSTLWKLRSAGVCMLLFAAITLQAQVKLPKLISDGMVLQRDIPLKIWGWAGRSETLAIQFLDSTYRTSADSSGRWSINLPPQQPGGPHTMRISARNNIQINDILIGDVWVCSGQSNMELWMKRVSPLYEKELAHSENSSIRQFAVPQAYNFRDPQEDLQKGNWISANPNTVPDFSAVAYFFARELYAKYQIPIGLINASLGGSPAEAWMSREALLAFPRHVQEAQRWDDSTLRTRTDQQDQERSQAWYSLLNTRDAGYKNSQPWFATDLDDSGWGTMNIPGYWSNTALGPVQGVVWFRKTVTIPPALITMPAKIILGRIVDADSVFMNGTFIGTTSYQYPPRRYPIPAGVLKAGKNTIVIRLINNAGIGGFVPDKPYQIESGKDIIDLKGEWRVRLGATMDPLASQTFIRWKPLGLYNGMISPLVNYRIRGVIWYQGESNAARPLEYRELLPALINDWRVKWNQGDFPFLFVQLANFMEAKNQPSESNWALLRESQLKTLSVPNTGMAVTIDIGEWNDIHPLNKKDVGKRLALAAQKIAYGETKVVASGPTFESVKVEGKRIILAFANTGSGLIAKRTGILKGFAIAGADRKFVWANARIQKNTVVVWSEKITAPVAVRYAWADNPEGANLYNREGLPASPFRTDEWVMQ